MAHINSGALCHRNCCGASGRVCCNNVRGDCKLCKLDHTTYGETKPTHALWQQYIRKIEKDVRSGDALHALKPLTG